MGQTTAGIIDNSFGYRTNEGVPSNGTSCIQILTIGGTPDGGSIPIATNAGKLSPSILWDSNNTTLIANIQAGLDSLFGTDETLVAEDSLSSGVGTISITFQNNSGSKVQPLLAVTNNLTGTDPTADISMDTDGVDATHRGAPQGATCEDSTNKNLYVNKGTSMNPTWALIVTT